MGFYRKPGNATLPMFNDTRMPRLATPAERLLPPPTLDNLRRRECIQGKAWVGPNGTIVCDRCHWTFSVVEAQQYAPAHVHRLVREGRLAHAAARCLECRRRALNRSNPDHCLQCIAAIAAVELAVRPVIEVPSHRTQPLPPSPE
ncbi:uncharacterized protein LOC128874269 [Hylaeus volcanicus]|uniref:uncharacterized protein LOC128874269 n=1 Tax=Hylaeus volcanicus TaxID=313075 RepID=UPI0023B87AC4|nr:uncharacterized protein LOC128874269 [Hylaeus volcanicus]